jgi:hypothetical protein
MSTTNIQNNLAYPNAATAITHTGFTRPQNPQPGAAWTNKSGDVEIWDGTKWNVVPAVSTRMATTSWVTNSIKQTITFNHSEDGRQVTVNEIIDFMDVMKRRMLILTEDFERHEQYPALKEAYEHYKLIERLCCGDEKKE